MTAVGVVTPPPGAGEARQRLARATGGLRLVRLHVASRRVPAALGVLAACGVVLRVALKLHWVQSGSAGAQQLPLLIEAGTAAMIAVTTYSPFGESERATGRWLPWLRLGTAVALAAVAVGALAAGAAAAQLPGGTLDVVRNIAGLTGIGLLSAAVLGGLLAWIGPMAYLVVAEVTLTRPWTSPWIWPARPPHDRGAAICAALVFAAGIAITTLRGARDSVSD
jgi:hypothetical protein